MNDEEVKESFLHTVESLHSGKPYMRSYSKILNQLMKSIEAGMYGAPITDFSIGSACISLLEAIAESEATKQEYFQGLSAQLNIIDVLKDDDDGR